MLAITPLESKHALDLDGLRRPEVTFWSVLDGDALVGCGAIKQLDDSHAEVKSMRTAGDRRGTGVASVLLAHILAEAKAMGLARLSLETGASEPFRNCRPGGSMRNSASNTAARSRTTGRIRSAFS